jgi:hypothetical protein
MKENIMAILAGILVTLATIGGTCMALAVVLDAVFGPIEE